MNILSTIPIILLDMHIIVIHSPPLATSASVAASVDATDLHWKETQMYYEQRKDHSQSIRSEMPLGHLVSLE